MSVRPLALAVIVPFVVVLQVACVPDPPPTGANVAPVVDSGPERSGIAGTDVLLAGTASDPDNGPGPLVLSWILSVIGPGDATSCTFTNTTTLTPTLNCTVAGNYLAQLRASDGATLTDDIGTQVSFTVNQRPVVDSGPELTGAAGTNVVLAGTASDPDNGPNPLELSWIRSVLGPGSATSCTFTNTTTLTPTLNCTVPGNYLVQLRAWDGLALGDDTGTRVTFT